MEPQLAMEQPGIITRIIRFYMDGFRSMTLGRTLWKVIIIKLIIMFGVLKLFFFQDFLESRFATDEERAGYVLEQITRPVQSQPNVRR
ncbi:hypothetical protein GF1_29710 [Desulfolithobacter dissulfuricans]|uniref:DUF4492 domain-containing protein n=1 Tax=Desulfolithobacter dissulfuricans TaxID=2795293 RepID=A0A915UBD5_9BACT|nr:DUF4492 domain-containing protein [Desulfolithobacter dissulfuricans]BCO10595.1 hypothetical protein GF1_29710 [Desulfolithobacter dissulfuricans]